MALERQVADADVSFAIPVTPAGVFFQDDFESYSTTADLTNNWTVIGSEISLVTTGGVNNSQYINCFYQGQQAGPYTISKNINSLNVSEIYVQFNFSQDADPDVISSKFIRLFGKSLDPEGYANATFGLKLDRVSYGNGDGITNDTQHFIRYDGVVTDPLVNVIVSTSAYNTPINQWDEFKIYWKYNTNNNRDGEVKVWINGTLRLHADNIKNRHNLNSREIDRVDLASYTSNPVFYPDGPQWNLRYDNVIMSTEDI